MRALYIILLLGLFFYGWRLCKKTICPPTESAIPAAVPADDDCSSALSLKDGKSFKSASIDNFRFYHSSSELLDPSDDLLITSSELTSYLTDNSNRVIQIKGHYLSEEDNDSSLKSLGLARARSIVNFFLDQGVPPVQMQIIGKKIDSNCVQDSVLVKGCSIAFGGRK